MILIGTPAHGNLGDHAIAEEEKNFIKEYFSEYNLYEIIMPLYNICQEKLKKLITPKDIIIISGGGWMGNLWLHNEITIRNIIKSYLDNNIIVFPQTIFYTNDEEGKKECKITSGYISGHKNLILCLREKNRLNLLETIMYLKKILNLFYVQISFCMEVVNMQKKFQEKKLKLMYV